MSKQRTRAATESLGFLTILTGILVLANILGVFLPLPRFDCTEKELHSLADGSKDLAGSLTDELHIKAYFTEDLPPPFNATERYVRQMLSEYQAASNGRIRITYVNPDTEDEKEEAEELGIQRVNHRAIENDSLTDVQGYRGLAFTYLERTEVIPVVEDTSGLEYAITMKIKRLVGDKTKIGLLGGHEGPTLAEGLSRLRQCLPQYEFEEVQANDELDEDLKAILVVGPGNEISEDELHSLNRFVIGGGALGVFGGSMTIEGLDGQSQPSAAEVDTGINTLLRPWGVVVGNGIVHDANCINVQHQVEFMGRQAVTAVPHPPLPIIQFGDDVAEHPAVFQLDNALMPFTSPVERNDNDPDGVDITILAESSENSWTEEGASVSLATRMRQEWNPRQDGPIPVMAAISGSIPSAFDDEDGTAENGRVLVAGSSTILQDLALRPPPQMPDQGGECAITSNVALALNIVDWLAQDEDLMAVRAKNVEDPLIDVPQDVREAEEDAASAQEEALVAASEGDIEQAEEHIEERKEAVERHKAAMESWETKKGWYKWGNMLGIPLVFALFGVVRWRFRQSKRQNLTL